MTLPLAAAIDAPVSVEGGKIAGTQGRNPSISVFKGIPFAASPAGDLRWRSPAPVVPWQGVKQTTAFGPSCIQGAVPRRSNTESAAAPAPSVRTFAGPWTYEFGTHNEISEDCLYLNVWTPAKSPAESLPVFVYIYGGGFSSGSGEVPIYDGEGLASKGLVVVTFNYRLGVFGFLAHPGLTRDSGHNASGNYGLLDQVAALRWVRANIAAFGGDPGRVTIAGQSAGSMSVHFLIASPLAKGLFQRAIAQSGGSGVGRSGGGPMMTARTLAEAEAEADGVKFAAAKSASSLHDNGRPWMKRESSWKWESEMPPSPWPAPPPRSGFLRNIWRNSLRSESWLRARFECGSSQVRANAASVAPGGRGSSFGFGD
jgi:para-nitrobenzyl esterase